MEAKTVTYTKNFLGNFYHWRYGAMETHIAAMAEDGWTRAAAIHDAGHVKVGTTIGAALLTGGLSLLGGASRTNSEVSITYIKG